MNEIDLIKLLNEIKEEPEIKAKLEGIKSILKTLSYKEEWADRIIRRADRITINFAAKYYSYIKDPELLKKALKADYLAEIERSKKWFYEWMKGLAEGGDTKLRELKKALGI